MSEYERAIGIVMRNLYVEEPDRDEARDIVDALVSHGLTSFTRPDRGGVA